MLFIAGGPTHKHLIMKCDRVSNRSWHISKGTDNVSNRYLSAMGCYCKNFLIQYQYPCAPLGQLGCDIDWQNHGQKQTRLAALRGQNKQHMHVRSFLFFLKDPRQNEQVNGQMQSYVLAIHWQFSLSYATQCNLHVSRALYAPPCPRRVATESFQIASTRAMILSSLCLLAVGDALANIFC